MSIFRYRANVPDNKLLLIFNGWGMDETVFRDLLAADIDTLILSDYSENRFSELVNILGQYQKISLLAWSMGVLQAQVFFTEYKELRKKLDFALAVNGTLWPIHADYGIAPEVFRDMAVRYSLSRANNFYRQMSGLDFKKFLLHPPQRSIQSQKRELDLLLKQCDHFKESDSVFDKIVISSRDLIMPTRNQHNFWKNQKKILVKGAHFPFYKWNNLSECMNFCKDATGEC